MQGNAALGGLFARLTRPTSCTHTPHTHMLTHRLLTCTHTSHLHVHTHTSCAHTCTCIHISHARLTRTCTHMFTCAHTQCGKEAKVFQSEYNSQSIFTFAYVFFLCLRMCLSDPVPFQYSSQIWKLLPEITSGRSELVLGLELVHISALLFASGQTGEPHGAPLGLPAGLGWVLALGRLLNGGGFRAPGESLPLLLN